MYSSVTKLDTASVAELDQLTQEVEFSYGDVRPGANAPSVVSKLGHSKWYDWSRTQKNNFKNLLQPHTEKAVVGWLLKFPENGFLDTQDYWVDTRNAGTIVAYSLTDGNRLEVAGERIECKRGEGVRFALNQLHSVPAEKYERNWACLMQMVPLG